MLYNINSGGTGRKNMVHMLEKQENKRKSQILTSRGTRLSRCLSRHYCLLPLSPA